MNPEPNMAMYVTRCDGEAQASAIVRIKNDQQGFWNL